MRRVRAMFVLYVVAIVIGLIFYSTVGILHK
jgi:hypothetical protein